MNKGKMGPFTLTVTIVILLLVTAFVAYSALNRDRPQIVLPDESSSTDGSQTGGDGVADVVSKVEINPQTVQYVIETLTRPERYTASMTLTAFWSGGSGTTGVEASMVPGCARLDTALPGGQTRHVIRTGDRTYVWYNKERTVYSGPAGAFSVDEEQWVPTYEDLLTEDPARIAEAGYETYQETGCVYAATAPDEGGYAEKYWVSVETGLLVAAERLQGENVVYRMELSGVQVGAPEAERFVLPDGTVLYEETD